MIKSYKLSNFATQFSRSMIETLISNKTRIKLLLKFFLNSNTTSYLRGLESEFGDSSNAIRLELNRLENADMLESSLQGNKKFFKANTAHPLFKDIHNLILKHVGIDKVIETVAERLGDLEEVYLTGSFAKGIDSQIIDLIFIGNVEKNYLIQLVEKVEKLINRKIRYLIYTREEVSQLNWKQFATEPLLIWSKEKL